MLLLVISEKTRLMANVFIEECKDSCSLTFVGGLHFRELIVIQRILKRHKIVTVYRTL